MRFILVFTGFMSFLLSSNAWADFFSQCKSALTRDTTITQLFLLSGGKLSDLAALENIEPACFKAHETLYNMTDLDLRKKRISNTQPIGNLGSRVSWIDLSENHINTLHPEMSNLFQLKTLILKANNFSQFPLNINQFYSLEHLNLNSNYISVVTSALPEDLISLSLSKNGIRDLQQIRSSASLKSLDVSYNKFQEIPDSFKEYESLRYINLSGNDLTTVDSFENLPESLTKIKLCDVNAETNEAFNHANISSDIKSIPCHKQVSGGFDHSCALLESGNVQCWGSNVLSTLGNKEFGGIKHPPTPVLLLLNGVHISSHSHHNCVTSTSGNVQCWGLNAGGQSDPGNTTKLVIKSPVTIPNIDTALETSAGMNHTCALLDSGKVNCWGGIEYDGGPRPQSILVKEIDGIEDAVQVSSGSMYSCALIKDGSVQCWGDGSENLYTMPSKVPDLHQVIQISLGYGHGCAVLGSGRVKCWGFGLNGELGNGERESTNHVVDVVGIDNAIHVTAGGMHSCAILKSGNVKCWGSNDMRQLGNEAQYIESTPITIKHIAGVTHLAASFSHTCAVLESGKIKCWGWNGLGQLGHADEGNKKPMTVFLSE